MLVRGPDLALRYAEPRDAPALFRLGSDAEVTRFFSWGPYRREAEALAYIGSLLDQRKRGERLEFVIVADDDHPIGVTGLSEFSLRDRRAVVGTWLGRDRWGSGANAQSKALVLALAFRRLGLIRTTALINPANGRSRTALERLGFSPEGVLRGWHVHEGVPQDCLVMGLLREEYEASPLAAVAVEIEGSPPARFVAGGPSDSPTAA